VVLVTLRPRPRGHREPMRRAVAIAALAAVMAVPPSAGAATLTDPQGDVDGWPEAGPSDDIVRSTAGHASKGRLYHTVSLAGTARDPATHTPLLLIETGDRMSRWCDYVIGRTDRGLGVYDCDYMDRVGSVKVTRSGGKVRYTFKRSAIGSPSEYGWAVVLRGQTRGTTAEYDRAPSEADSFISYR
jgi:hypothetical protein